MHTLLPLAYRTNRYSNKTMDINGFTIPKDVTIVVPIYHFHHNPIYWKDPEKFNPDRYTIHHKINVHDYNILMHGVINSGLQPRKKPIDLSCVTCPLVLDHATVLA